MSYSYAPTVNIGRALSDGPVEGPGLVWIAQQNTTLKVEDDIWEQTTTDHTRWNKLFPYQLIVVEVVTEADGTVIYRPYVSKSKNSDVSVHDVAVFTFPFPPEALVQTTPFAINVDVTLNGIIEEHNGIPIKLFQFRGTMGYLPMCDNVPGTGALDFATSFAGGAVQGTINQLAGTLADVRDLGSSLGISTATASAHLESEFTPTSILAQTTGYYQMNLLREFLEQYAAIKKTSEGKNLRLALAIWKETPGQVHLVTPVSFSVTKDVSSPMEAKYSLDFKAWKRVSLKTGGTKFVRPTPVRTNVSLLSRGINILSSGRKVLQDLGHIPSAVLGDITHINEIFRQSIGFCKDLAGVIQNFADMPEAVKNSIVKAVKDDGKDFKTAGKQVARSASNFYSNIMASSYNNTIGRMSDFQFTGAKGGPKSVSNPAQAKANSLLTNLSQKELQDVPVDRLSPYISTAAKSAAIQDLNKIRQLTRNDFENYRNTLSSFTDKLSFLLGAGSETYKTTYGLDNITPIKDEPTDSDWEVLYSLNDSVMALNSLAATGIGEPSEVPRLIDSMAQLVRGTGTAFRVPTSKFAVPFPYGATLESLSQQYLGDSTRWMEIATLNGLKSPYVDETGFDLYLIADGYRNNVLVPYSQNLFIGQRVSIGSSSATRGFRYIVEMVRDLNGNLVITLDGDSNMNTYRKCDRAFIHAYLPDTINSECLVYIPSDREPIENDYLTKDIPGVDSLDPMVAAGGVDLLLDSSGDLVITPDGDCRYATGLRNIIQNLEIALSVQQGKLYLHPGFGLPIKVGTSTADVNTQSVLSAVKEMFLSDPTFVRVDGVRIKKNGAALSIDASAVVEGTTVPLPLSFGIR